MEQGQFIELLSDLVKIGEAQDNRLTKEEISRYFADLDLAEEQMELLYQYLAANKILVEGAVMPARQEESEGMAARLEPEAERYLEQYLEDLVSPYGEVKSTLISSSQRGDILTVTLRAECQEEIGRSVPIYTQDTPPDQEGGQTQE